MPGKDGTGPRGEGPMTGSGFGKCNPNAPNQNECGRPRGRGCGQRRGQGYRFQDIKKE